MWTYMNTQTDTNRDLNTFVLNILAMFQVQNSKEQWIQTVFLADRLK